MSQQRTHESPAERQSAYRRRQYRHNATQSDLATLARSLHSVIQSAVVYKEFPLLEVPVGRMHPVLNEELAAARPYETMMNLIRFFNIVYDPVRNPDGKHRRPAQFAETPAPTSGRLAWG